MNAQYFSLYSIVLTVINLDAFVCQLFIFERHLNLYETCTLVEIKFSNIFIPVVSLLTTEIITAENKQSSVILTLSCAPNSKK